MIGVEMRKPGFDDNCRVFVGTALSFFMRRDGSDSLRGWEVTAPADTGRGGRNTPRGRIVSQALWGRAFKACLKGLVQLPLLDEDAVDGRDRNSGWLLT